MTAAPAGAALPDARVTPKVAGAHSLVTVRLRAPVTVSMHDQSGQSPGLTTGEYTTRVVGPPMCDDITESTQPGFGDYSGPSRDSYDTILRGKSLTFRFLPRLDLYPFGSRRAWCPGQYVGYIRVATVRGGTIRFRAVGYLRFRVKGTPLATQEPLASITPLAPTPTSPITVAFTAPADAPTTNYWMSLVGPPRCAMVEEGTDRRYADPVGPSRGTVGKVAPGQTATFALMIDDDGYRPHRVGAWCLGRYVGWLGYDDREGFHRVARIEFTVG